MGADSNVQIILGLLLVTSSTKHILSMVILPEYLPDIVVGQRADTYTSDLELPNRK